jgi:hypothetical protein
MMPDPRPAHLSSALRLSAVLALALSSLAFAPRSTALAQPAPAAPRPSPVRLMLGVGAEGGGFVDQASGLMGGAQVHAGVHFFGVEIYGLSQAFIGGLTMGSHRGEVQGLWWNSAMLGFGAGPFHLAAGPSLDFAWGCSDEQGGADCFHGAPLYGIDGRVALALGSFELSANVHPTFYGHSTVTGITVGIGWVY